MIGLQVFAYRELDAQREAEDSAARVSEQVSLLQHTGQLIVPLYIEFTATAGVAEAEVWGLDRIELDDTLGIDFVGFVSESRAQLDEALAALSASSGAVRLPSGVTIGEEIASIESELADVRAEFDAQAQRPDSVNAVFDRLVSFVDDISEQTRQVLQEAATTSELAGIGAESEQFLSTLQSATTNLRLVADASIAGGERSLVLEAMVATGAFEESLDRLRSLLDGQRLTEFDELVASPAFAAVDEALPTLVEALTLVDDSGINVIDDTSTLTAIIDVLIASFDRLTALQSYGNSFLEEQVQRAGAIRAQADADRRDAIRVMVAVLGISLVLLGLILLSILRPLRRLVRHSRQVGEGDLALAPVKPTGPTDIRVVMRTFNEMVTTLRAYDAQVRRLALGDTEIDRTLPGPLGDTLRQSVSHLAAVTSKLHASEAAANEQARTDSLTGLANRAAALEHLARMAMAARLDERRSAIVFLDLDGFKSVNDTQGHGEGDRILGEIGARLKAACPGHLVARIGGDEFIVLMDQVADQEQATELAHRLIEVVSAPCTGTSGQLFTISASAGVSIVDGSRDPLDNIAQADSAVYHAKQSGRGRVEVYDEQLAREIEDRADMALTMRHGIVSGQFSIKLQPIIDIASKEPVGAEALLRWNRPGIGEVGPNEFIPIAERTGVILDLDAWVLEQAVGVLREWQDEPLTSHLRIAVNISGRHIMEGTLSPLLQRLCERAEVDPAMIDLEITETHLVADVARAAAVVDDLRSRGIKVAIDDFGTGYSSMSYLHQLTVDTLKIDGVFVAGMCENPLDHTIVELLLRLGDSLGLKVVAEGVDSIEKLTALQALGCPWAQGFYIARPMSVTDATVWLRQQVTLAEVL